MTLHKNRHIHRCRLQQCVPLPLAPTTCVYSDSVLEASPCHLTVLMLFVATAFVAIAIPDPTLLLALVCKR